MRHEKLGPMLIKRLAANEHLIDEMREFVDVRPSTVQEWLERLKNKHPKPRYPRGENLVRLWYFLAAGGVESPEMERLPKFGAYLGRLLAYQVINLQDATSFCGAKDTNTQAALDAIYGESQPANPKETIEGLEEVFGAELADREQELRKKLNGLKRPDEPKTKPEVPQPAATLHEQPSEVATPSSTFVPAASASATSPQADNTAFILELAHQICALHINAEHALSVLSDEEIAQVRAYANSYVLFGLTNNLSRMGSTRALNDRKQVK